ncbi:DUF4397 domain-containing protein [Flavobacterium sp. Sd200]|uniref:DUF4397 domain-containing protein n=1 Tax=Flavobacterium sp. Sd200 TaxID=2692211 RepID=UPI001368A4A8|nr:DUF4397 domain-containing protein [Flavobacterium sp. Sd200]MXN92828.1 DUF4397 domain-containing protein [Flavobacterium sp. Sd200]
MKLNFITKLMMGVAITASLASCSLDDDNNYDIPQQNVARGLIANASPSSGNLYFFADENQVNETALNYAEARGYYHFRLGQRVLSLKDQSGTVLDTVHVTLRDGDYFSAFAVNTFDDIELVSYTDSLEYPEANHALVRFINLSPDAPAIKIDATGITQSLATDVAFKDATPFISVPRGSREIRYTNAQTGATLFTDTNVEFSPGRIYTIYTKGFVTPPTGSNETFSTKLLQNY